MNHPPNHPCLHHLTNHLYLHMSNHLHLHLLHHLYLDPQQMVVNRLRKILAFNIKGIYLDLLDWMGVYILECEIRSKLFPSGPCSSIIYESFGERADLNGYSWATLSDETKLLYWDEFHCHWDDAKTPLVQACWENKAKERYRQYIYNISSK
uniref:Uncharacterized protein n=1 Tax=Lactuca sativa TaxID=4236 RepID=A0A9R1WYP9_LACSA|nr:hypothetical protein LSAT_V11C800436250 [Lactuca sativa]